MSIIGEVRTCQAYCLYVRLCVITTESYMQTPLHVCSAVGAIDLVKLLLQHGADPTIEGDRGMCRELALQENHM